MPPAASPSLSDNAQVLWWPGWLVWGAAAAALVLLDAHVGVGSLALVLVLASALAAFWWPRWLSLSGCVVAVLVFDFAFVSPRGTLAVDLRTDALLLVTMLLVAGIVTVLVGRQRQALVGERAHRERLVQLQLLSDALRESDEPRQCAPHLLAELSRLTGAPAALWLAAEPSLLLGQADEAERDGLRHCAGSGQAMGPGTGRHEHQLRNWLPLRGRNRSHGAALLALASDRTEETLQQAQALCDLMGSALERATAWREAAQAAETARNQTLRNTLLAAIAHDHRTPLAAITGAASSLLDQDQRLTPAQRERLARGIVDEAAHLTRITDNTLMLARLEAPGLRLRCDWESLEEIVGSVLRRVHARASTHRLTTRIQPGLPLIRCDPVLVAQLLDNLIDNALCHGGNGAPVEVSAERRGDELVLAVADRGPGVPEADRVRVFERFERLGPGATGRGAGLGLALAQAVARAHGARLRCLARPGGGAVFECHWPLTDSPPQESAAWA